MQAKELRRILRYRAALALPGVLGRLPEPWARALGGGIGWCAYGAIARDRRLAHQNLRRVYPRLESASIRLMARRSFVALGKNIVDFVRYPQYSESRREAMIHVRGEEFLESRRGRGAVVVSGHLGCWELLGAALARRGFPLKGLARPMREKRLQDLLTAHRRAMGIEVIDTRSPVRALRHLKQGGWLAVLIDQRVPRGIPVRFLGQPTVMTDAPARAAWSTGVPLIPVAVYREGKHHCLEVGEPLPAPAGPGDVLPVTQALADWLSRRIEAHPLEWMWIHPRWPKAKARSAQSGPDLDAVA